MTNFYHIPFENIKRATVAQHANYLVICRTLRVRTQLVLMDSRPCNADGLDGAGAAESDCAALVNGNIFYVSGKEELLSALTLLKHVLSTVNTPPNTS